MSRHYLGCDPGKSGALALVSQYGFADTIGLDETEADVVTWLCAVRDDISHAYLEKVHSTPPMGVVSAFTFGSSYGFLRGILIALGIPFETISPMSWQKSMGCLTKGDKNVSKAKAQELFPTIKITHRIADAILLAEYCRGTQ